MPLFIDREVRVVSLDNLHAMCAHISGMSHRYSVTNVSEHRVRVTYSNPDPRGFDHPVSVYFPCYPGGFGETNVVLDCTSRTGPHHSFDPLTNCPELIYTTNREWVERKKYEEDTKDTPIF